MPQWHDLTAVTDLPPSGMLSVPIAGRKPAILILHLDDDWYAVDDRCSHEDYPLSIGCIHHGMLKCSLHGSRFDLRTGQPLDEPATDPIRTYPVRVEDGRVWVEW